MPDVDLSLVCGRRPDLLELTLRSFTERMFGHIPISRAIVNIDPIFGSVADGEATRDVARRFFPHAEISTPETPGFCAAVRRNWAASTGAFVFHLEDDWLLNEDITQDVFSHFDEADVDQVSFESKEKKWDWDARGSYHQFMRRETWFGYRLPIKKKMRPFFTTSPSLLRGEFARRASSLMNPAFDPEKQFSAQVNRRLERYVAKRRNKLLRARDGFYITDIGRDWRDDRGIAKVAANAVSTWVFDR